MTTTKSYDIQPTKLDYASPTQIKFQMSKLPKVEYFCTAANIPGIDMPFSDQKTPLADIPWPGEKVNFEALNVTFIVDENLENYKEIHVWLMGIGCPKDYSQARDL